MENPTFEQQVEVIRRIVRYEMPDSSTDSAALLCVAAELTLRNMGLLPNVKLCQRMVESALLAMTTACGKRKAFVVAKAITDAEDN